MGHPGAPHFPSPSSFPHPPHIPTPPPPPPPPPRRPRHRGPGEIRRNNQRAACHQAARASPASPTAPVSIALPPSSESEVSSEASASVISSNFTLSVTSLKNKQSIHKCDLCEFSSSTKHQHRVSVHMGHTHKKENIDNDLESSKNIEQIDGNCELQMDESISDEREITYTISCKEVKTKSEVEEDLGEVWKYKHLSGWGVESENETFIVIVGSKKICEDFSATSADHMLETLPWPKSYHVISKGKPRYM